jgi:hypothetical protein
VAINRFQYLVVGARAKALRGGSSACCHQAKAVLHPTSLKFSLNEGTTLQGRTITVPNIRLSDEPHDPSQHACSELAWSRQIFNKFADPYPSCCRVIMAA